MNIRVDLETPITDGREVVFRSPVDCSQVTGLIVYYNGERKEFAFADAHGNNVGDIDHLFAENVVVKVILDLRAGMAFVQNADTNAYLEGRFSELERAIAAGGGGGSADLNNYYDKEFIDLVIEDADRRFSAIEDNFYDGSYTDIEDNPLPIEISTEAEMTALLDTADIGSVYKYAEDAEDSGTYEKGALYIVEAVEE